MTVNADSFAFSASVSTVFRVNTCINSRLKHLVAVEVVVLAVVFVHGKDFETIVFVLNQTNFSRSTGSFMN